MTVLYFGLLLFGGSHLLSILLSAVRNRLSAWIGEARYKGLYSLVSLAGGCSGGSGLLANAR